MRLENLELLEKAIKALSEAEQAIRLEEKESVNKPMYRTRILLNLVKEQYKNGGKVCNFTPYV